MDQPVVKQEVMESTEIVNTESQPSPPIIDDETKPELPKSSSATPTPVSLSTSTTTTTVNSNKRQRLSEDVKEEDDDGSEPMHEVVGGSSIRMYLNKHITPHILDGLKEVGTIKPQDPLKWLGEFLIERSKTLDDKTLASD